MNAAQITLFVQHFRFISTKSYKNESFLSRFKYFSYLCAYISKLPISNCSMYYQSKQ